MLSTIDTTALFYVNNHIADDVCGSWTKTPENAGGEKLEDEKEKRKCECGAASFIELYSECDKRSERDDT